MEQNYVTVTLCIGWFWMTDHINGVFSILSTATYVYSSLLVICSKSRYCLSCMFCKVKYMDIAVRITAVFTCIGARHPQPSLESIYRVSLTVDLCEG